MQPAGCLQEAKPKHDAFVADQKLIVEKSQFSGGRFTVQVEAGKFIRKNIHVAFDISHFTYSRSRHFTLSAILPKF